MNTQPFKISLLIMALLLNSFGCSRSGRRSRGDTTLGATNSVKELGSAAMRNVVRMEKINGVYQIPVLVNGVKMSFIFDTGASTISISGTEAIFLLKQGSLTLEDIKGVGTYSDANGDISEGTIIVLRSVQIGNRILTDIPASVVHNLTAPLLIGQSALEKFGTITIDNAKGQITFD
jgi:aspartyl protease family protein